jgi:inner membrane protein
MDNATHSLAAVLVAEGACVVRGDRPDAARFRTAALWVSLLANNLPDLDFVYRNVTPGKLGYLLHHRGHSHTIVAATGLALVAFALVTGPLRLSGVRFEARDRRTLLSLALFGTLLHIGMDFQNNYGVHPFWPFDDRWYYGDFLYIVEPLVWAFAVPVIALLARTRVATTCVVAGFGVALLYGAVARHVPASQALGLLFVAACVAVAARTLSRRGRIVLAGAGWMAVTTAFFVASRAVRAAVVASAERRFPETQLVDVVRTPALGNPLCWSVIAIGTERDRYVARRSIVSLAPFVVSPRRCGSGDPRVTAAPLAAVESSDGRVLWRSEFRAPLAELRALSKAHCDAAAFLRYARAPFWFDGAQEVIGDLRFDRGRGLGFAGMALSKSGACPPHVPPWTPPRAELLGGS